jgi:hypothetical protein
VKPYRRRQTPTERRQAAERDAERAAALEAAKAEADAAGLVFVDGAMFTYTMTKEAFEREKRLRIVPRR